MKSRASAVRLAGQKNYAEAEPLLIESCQGLQQRQASLPAILNAPRRIMESLVRLKPRGVSKPERIRLVNRP